MLAVKDVQFNGAMLRAAQDADNIIWVGVAWVCQGLGLKEGRIKYERKKMQEDLVLSQGTKFYPLGTDDANSDVLCLKLDFLPLWLAKISITPTMKKENPQLVENLVTYQLKAKEVLAAAFLNKEGLAPSTQRSYEQKIDRLESKIDKMYKDMSSLANIILDWKESTGKTLPDKITISSSDKGSEWKTAMYQKMDRICEKTKDFSGRMDVMNYIYRYINKHYGIVWEQEIREYREQTKAVRLSIIQVVESKEMLKSIFESVLTDLEFKYCGSAQTHNEIKDFRHEWIEVTIAPLIEKYHDNSNAGMITFRRVYKKMDESYHICWKNLTTRYVKEYGKMPSKKDLVLTRPSLHNKFVAAVKELMEE
ncbi:hypothetical protein H9X90_05320 [Faecalicatena contorta]|uniref:phage antirepressor N-terminal domain-containing protein n=1 Tax=Faecalicatena contorta TaxID=39482 RepID=UPI00195F4F5B|nr:phage antirepressor N-terminal domain-containing protein [Faecalicatena contorta]MBM6685424.1 hypothetical protein [Faecalicatena contorta]MBM6710165.1 hypothetical protein [Faecalicatena contorta]